jgi:hypothetical protein
MNNPQQLNYTQQLEHRIAMIQYDIKKLVDNLDDNRLMETLDKTNALIHIINIELSSDLTRDDSLSKKLIKH